MEPVEKQRKSELQRNGGDVLKGAVGAPDLSDAELVRSTIDGDIRAFDYLVLRHRRLVLNLAYSAIGNWDGAEDVAQQAFLEAMSSLSHLREPRKFRAWLSTITRRCATRHRIQHAAQEVEFDDAVLYLGGFGTSNPIGNELRDRVRASLNELSIRNRRVVVMHYLEGYSCKEIGHQLDVPTGTVKRILHESRNNLRQQLGIAEPTKRIMTGELLMATQAKHTGPKRLCYFTGGDLMPKGLMEFDIAHSICLSTNKQSKTIEQIAEDIDANARYVENILPALVREDIVSKDSQNRYRTNFIALDAEDWARLMNQVNSKAVKAADYIADYLPEFEKAWNQTSLPGQGYKWDDEMWLALGVFMCGFGVGRNTSFEGRAYPLRESGNRYWLGGFEASADQPGTWATAVQGGMHNETDQLNCVRLCSIPSLARDNYLENRHDNIRVLTAVARGAFDAGAVASAIRYDIKTTEELLVKLVEMGFLVRKSGKLALNFPLFAEQDSEILFAIIDSAAASFCRDILEPASVSVEDQLVEDYGYLPDQIPYWRRVFMVTLAGESLHELMKRGLLPELPDPAPGNFAAVGWFGEHKLMSWSK